ncbi:hypothetical protein OHA18_39565 [Kribbella sp. NBC_00709]|uniref:hypothetical protein n=1 Tax=Kribbella sp. NBC_00709 TaxID=2975972 RepID=UPI002E2A1A2F|nr:hypothetical protein [Kribbella sp. NBC_00709]
MAVAELYDRASSLLERRFLKNAFLPVAVFPLVVSWPYLIQGDRLGQLTDWWESLSAAAKIVLGLVYFIGTWFVAAIVASQWRNIIRLFEGYPFLHTKLAKWSIAWHQARRDEATQWEHYLEFPARHEVLPTRLGNILRTAERYGYARYGADIIVMWPRLYHLLPESVQRDVEDRRATVEFLLVTSLFWGLFGVVDFGFLTIAGSPAWIPCLCLLVGTAGAVLAYESCLPAAMEYGERIKAGFDLYRVQLLTILGLETPASLTDESKTWKALDRFIREARRKDLEKIRAASAPTIANR